MGYTYEQKATNYPNFLASEIGLITKTVQVDDTDVVADEYGFKTIKAGTVYPKNDATAKGIIFENVDVTHGAHAGSLIVAGRIYKNRLHTTPIAAAITPLAASGIVLVDAEETVRG